MKKVLLSKEKGNFYKANLHCHSTYSDGVLSPSEIKELYKSMGYSIVAFTDHNVLMPHDELKDDDFLPLNGYEMDFSEDLFSKKVDTSYNVYYYQKDVFGTALVSGSFKTIATYTYNTYDYNCKTEPSTYQSYACSYMQSTITELAKTMKKTFYKFINEAGVSVYNL